MINFFFFIGKILHKIRTLIRAINISNPLYIYVEDKKKDRQIRVNLKLDFKVRWNTTYDMLRKIIAFKPIFNEITMNYESIPNLSVIWNKQY